MFVIEKNVAMPRSGKAARRAQYDTLVNMEGRLTIADIDALTRSQELGTPIASQEKGERDVRIVGPSFFPVQ